MWLDNKKALRKIPGAFFGLIYLVQRCNRLSGHRLTHFDGRQPAPLILGLTANDIEEDILDRLGNWAARAFANRHSINRTHRCNFSSSAGEEDFVGHVEHFTRNLRFADGNTEILGNRSGTVTRDAAENAVAHRRCVDFTLIDDKDVLAAAFADIAVYVQGNA